ncbi:RNA-guided endonuclease InsQ/TnpB family protein [Candidatus Mycobacterium methanotrophicum]|uniref:Transposase n=1 Tax=Candidatus Mycobacterium methanotrophicum TaxID=2943498 RepID=A0ABY4QSA5_9MYCO|nr:transposase [Candidatus Mycobacterium methanotrophicum]UQX12633.1 transposase [Candidatus Mycobacterium methanotrophicum]
MLVEQCRHARFVWNLAVKQQAHWQPGRQAAGYNEQCAQLTAARAEYDWLAAGSQTVQQQALRDFAQAMRNFFHGAHRRPTWRKAGTHEGFRRVGVKPRHLKRLSRRHGQVWIPKVGWVRFRWTRDIPDTVKSYRATLDRSGRWHIAFAAIPEPVPGPSDGSAVGIDRGLTVSAALSSGELLCVPGLRAGETNRLRRLQQRLARAQRGSHRRARTKRAIARLRARETDRRRDWVEKTTTDVARRFDTIYTSQRCSACRHVAPENRKSQAVFQCVACGAGPCNADVNAARNIAAGRAVTARGDFGACRSANREPQLCPPAA